MVPGTELIDAITSCYDHDGMDETIVICRSNKRANLYNCLLYTSPVNEKEAASSSKSHNASFNGSLMAFRSLNNKGRNLSLGARFGYSDSESASYSDSKTEFFEKDSISDISRYTDRNSDSRNWSCLLYTSRCV